MGLQVFETVKNTISAYTGLSPAALFTALALSWAAYYVLSTIFVATMDYRKVARELNLDAQPPVQLGEITEQELQLYDGSHPHTPLLMAIKGQIYDVSQSRMFYGPGGPYALFAGKDASRALAKMSFDDKDLTGDLSGLGPFELDALQDWEYKFMGKYKKVGTIKKTTVPGADGSSSEEPAEATERNLGSPEEPDAVEVLEPAALRKRHPVRVPMSDADVHSVFQHTLMSNLK